MNPRRISTGALPLSFLVVTCVFVAGCDDSRNQRVEGILQIAREKVDGECLIYFVDETWRGVGGEGIAVETSDPQFSDHSINVIAELNQQLPVRSLNLRDTGISEKAIAEIGTFEELSFLVLAGSKVDGKSLCALEGIINLKVLNVERIRIGQEGMRCIASMTTLEELFLGGTDVASDDLEFLQQLPHLKRVWLTGCPNVELEKITELRTRRPDVEFID